MSFLKESSESELEDFELSSVSSDGAETDDSGQGSLPLKLIDSMKENKGCRYRSSLLQTLINSKIFSTIELLRALCHLSKKVVTSLYYRTVPHSHKFWKFLGQRPSLLPLVTGYC
jgi:hypothetical protein